MIKELIIGTWKLEAFDIIKNGVRDPWRQNVTGMLIYTSANSMSVSINSFIHESATWEEKNASILFYAGTFEVDEEKMEIKHQVLYASNPDRIGKEMKRNVVMNEDGSMQLTGHAGETQFSLKWNKIRSELSCIKENVSHEKVSLRFL